MVTFEHFAVSFVRRVGLFVSAFPCTGDALQEFGGRAVGLVLNDIEAGVAAWRMGGGTVGVAGSVAVNIEKIDTVASLDDLTIILLDQRKPAFDDIVDRLDADSTKRRQAAGDQKDNGATGTSEEFFSGNIGSLLDVAANVTRIEIKRSSFSNRRHEEIDFILK